MNDSNIIFYDYFTATLYKTLICDFSTVLVFMLKDMMTKSVF